MKIDCRKLDGFGLIGADFQAPASVTIFEDCNESRAPPIVDGDFAVRVATARLNEKSGGLDPSVHRMLLPLAIELAALLCAYGMIAEEADRMQARAAEQPVEHSGVGETPAAPVLAYGAT